MKDVIFKSTFNTMQKKSLRDGLEGGQVNLVSVLVWCIREMRLHQTDMGKDGSKMLNFNLKMDGRPFWGKLSSIFYYCTMCCIIVFYQHCENRHLTAPR